MAERPVRRQTLEVGAGCLNWARPDLCGERGVTRVPTAIRHTRFPKPVEGTCCQRKGRHHLAKIDCVGRYPDGIRPGFPTDISQRAPAIRLKALERQYPSEARNQYGCSGWNTAAIDGTAMTVKNRHLAQGARFALLTPSNDSYRLEELTMMTPGRRFLPT
jgi:hypothetical protein